MLIRASSSHGWAQMAVLSTDSNLQIPTQHSTDHAPTRSCVHFGCLCYSRWLSTAATKRSVFVGESTSEPIRPSRWKLEIHASNFAGRTSKWSRRPMRDKDKAAGSELMLRPQVCLLLSNLQPPVLNIQSGASQWHNFAVQPLEASNEGNSWLVCY